MKPENYPELHFLLETQKKTSDKKNMEQNNICPDNESMPERCTQKANQNGILLQNELKVIKKMITGLNQNGKTQK